MREDGELDNCGLANRMPGRDDDFTVRNQKEIADAATATTRIMSFLLAGIAAVSLVVGGIGITNIMLVSVTERTREIGIRMAVGARARDILLQFLTEAVTLSSIGGTLGILLGVSAHDILRFAAYISDAVKLHSEVLSGVANGPTLVSVGIVLIAFFSSALIGVASGFYPA